MLLIPCPYCEEERPELEFRHAGEAHVARPADITDISDEAFEQFFFIRQNPKGIVFERWRHIHGCGRFFNAARHTVSDRFYTTYKAGEPKPAIVPAAHDEPAVHGNREPAELNVSEPAEGAAQ